MKLGVDFDGTITRYAVCYRSGSCDGSIATQTETLEGAIHELEVIQKRKKNLNLCRDSKYWIMKQTFKYEKVYDVEGGE